MLYGLTGELIEHIVALIVFSAIGICIILRRTQLFRTLRAPQGAYWGIVVLCFLFVLLNSSCIAVHLWSGDTASTPLLRSLVLACNTLVVPSVIILLLMSYKLVTTQARQSRRVLAIGAHPDDIELACGATLAKMHDAGYLIKAIVLTQGERGGNAANRPHEAERGAQFLGLQDITVYPFTDGRLGQQADDLLVAIETAVRDFKPDIIFTHSANDQHQDHQAVHAATLRAARNHSTIFCYESPSVTRAFDPTFFVDVSGYVDIKIESVKAHKDQQRKPYMSAERVRGMAIYRGSQAKTRFAEAFESVRSLSSTLGDV